MGELAYLIKSNGDGECIGRWKCIERTKGRRSKGRMWFLSEIVSLVLVPVKFFDGWLDYIYCGQSGALIRVKVYCIYQWHIVE